MRLVQAINGLALLFWLCFVPAPADCAPGNPQERQSRPPETRVYVLDTVVVTGNRPQDLIARPKTESAGLEQATSVVNQEEIDRQGAKTVVEALNYVPGAWIESRGRKVKQFFSIRGQRYPYPDYALDGAWQREFLELPYFFSSEDLERLEVMRSSAALMTGLSSLAGVVNLVPRRFTQRETTLRVEYGSFGTSRLNLSHGGAVRDLSYSLSFGWPRSEGPKGRHAQSGLTHFRASAQWDPDEKLSFSAHLLRFDGSWDLAQAQPPAAARYQDALEKFDPMKTTLAVLKALYKPGDKASTELVLNLADRDHTYVNEASSPAQKTSERDYEWGVNLTQAVLLSPNNALRLGGLYNHWAAPNGKRFYAGRRTDLETYSAVVADEHQFGPLSVDAGVRWERTYINEYGAFNIEGTASGFQNVAPITDLWEPSLFTENLGSSYTVTENLSLNLNLSRGNIKPRTGELDLNLTEPKTETRTKLDFGFQARKAGVGSLSAAGFLTKQKDAIVLSGQTAALGGRVMELYLNQDQDQLGLELDARTVPLNGNLQLFGNLLAMRSRYENSGAMKRNEIMPRFIAAGGAYLALDRLDFNVLWKYVSAYKSARFAAGNPPSPQPLGDFHNLSLTVGYLLGARPVNRLYLEIENLANDKYSTVVGYPDFGRRFTVGVRSTYK